MNTTTTKTDLVEPKAVVEATSPGCEAAQERMIAEALRQQPIERTVTILADDYDGLKTICKHYREKCAEVTAQRDELQRQYNQLFDTCEKDLLQARIQRDELLAALKQAETLLEPCIRKMNIRTNFSKINTFENTIRAAITKADQH